MLENLITCIELFVMLENLITCIKLFVMLENLITCIDFISLDWPRSETTLINN